MNWQGVAVVVSCLSTLAVIVMFLMERADARAATAAAKRSADASEKSAEEAGRSRAAAERVAAANERTLALAEEDRSVSAARAAADRLSDLRPLFLDEKNSLHIERVTTGSFTNLVARVIYQGDGTLNANRPLAQGRGAEAFTIPSSAWETHKIHDDNEWAFGPGGMHPGYAPRGQVRVRLTWTDADNAGHDSGWHLVPEGGPSPI